MPDNKKIYDDNWIAWHDMKVFGPASSWLRSLVKDQLENIKQPIHSILDLGCGEGTITNLLAAKFPSAQVTGTDFSITGIDFAENRYELPNLKFEYDDANKHLEH